MSLRRSLLWVCAAIACIVVAGPIRVEARVGLPDPAAGVSFPLPRALKTAVRFWRDVFTRYSVSEVVFHDEKDLSRIYGTFPLGSPWAGTREQTRRIRSQKRRIRKVLIALAGGRRPPSSQRRTASRIRKVFEGAPRSVLRRAASRVRAQPGLREKFREGYLRSGRYLPRFLRIFRRRGLPEDLALLPHVESSFQSGVYSRARALGMWQFTRGTARLFMRVDGLVDERRDPYLSAEGAAELLKRSYQELRSWPLAITSYNYGIQGMRRAVRLLGTRDIGAIVRSYRGRTFGFASRNFYAEFLAAVHVHKNAHKYFGFLRPEPPARFDVVPLLASASFRGLARLSGIAGKALRKLNPALRSPVLRGRRRIPRGYPLRVPKGAGRKVRRATGGGGSPAVAAASSKWHVVRPGDTLSAIARRRGSSVARVMEANGLRSARILPGEKLLIPGASGSKRRTGGSGGKAPAPPKAARSLRKGTRRPSPAGGKPKPARRPSGPSRKQVLREALAVRPTGNRGVGVVRIRENETLGHFSEWLEVRPRVIRRLNRLAPGRGVKAGSELRVPLQRVSSNAFVELRLRFHRGIEENFFRTHTIVGTVRHKIRLRENVWKIVRETYGVPLWLVRRYNPEMDLRRLEVGQEILVPVLDRMED